MGVTGFLRNLEDNTNEEKNDPFHFLIELEYQGFLKTGFIF